MPTKRTAAPRISRWGLAVAVTSFMILGAKAKVADAPKPDPWADSIQRFEEWDRKNTFPRDAVLFVGSSSIVKWATRESFPQFDVINRGFGGSQIADTNRHIDRIVLPYRARTIVLYAGDNDIAAGKSPERVLSDFQTFVRIIGEKQPETPILFISIKPSRARWNLWPKMAEANRLIESFCRTAPRLVYADIATPMLDDKGVVNSEWLSEDGLHLSPAGYRLWTHALTPLLQRAVKRGSGFSKSEGTSKTE